MDLPATRSAELSRVHAQKPPANPRSSRAAIPASHFRRAAVPERGPEFATTEVDRFASVVPRNSKSVMDSRSTTTSTPPSGNTAVSDVARKRWRPAATFLKLNFPAASVRVAPIRRPPALVSSILIPWAGSSSTSTTPRTSRSRASAENGRAAAHVPQLCIRRPRSVRQTKTASSASDFFTTLEIHDPMADAN
jgi:hypothetical protein